MLMNSKANQRIKFPRQCFGKISKRPEEFLLICYYDPFSISTVPEVVASIQSESCFSITVCNMFEHRQDTGYLKLDSNLNLDKFSGIIIHNSVSYNIDNLRSLDSLVKRKLKDYEGIKVIFKQDENYRFRELADYIGETKFDIVFSCLRESDFDIVYPSAKVGNPRIIRMLTGYVTPTLRSISLYETKRSIDIGYRGSIQPLSFGRLAFEKRKIGDDVAKLLADRNLSIDISSRWNDRIGGEAWFDFLKSCKATLGTESGASVFDVKGDLDSRCQAIEAVLGPFREDHAYAEAYLEKLKDLEGVIYYNQLSPRHFEAAATKTLQLLYPGEYSGIFKPGRHFFVLNRDGSNLDEAVELILDEKRCSEIIQAAYDEIIQDRSWWIESFVKTFDIALHDSLNSKCVIHKTVFKASNPTRNILLIAAHEPSIDPRLTWIANSAPKILNVHQLGVLQPTSKHGIVHFSKRSAFTMAYPRIRCAETFFSEWYPHVATSRAGSAGLHELLFLQNTLALNKRNFCQIFHAPYDCNRISQFKWYLQYILDTSATLISQACRMRGIHAIIATDLDTLAAGLVLKGIFKVPLFYDAHEYWPEADLASFEFEKQFWVEMERRLVIHADYRQTVSPEIAAIMKEQYECEFEVTPNAEPMDESNLTLLKPKRSSAQCHFLYQGAFAVGRGLDLLIKVWPNTDERAILSLRGPENSYKLKIKKIASTTGLLDKRIFFPEPVSESHLIKAATDADVGLIPYTPTGINYKHCCPNKLSQYMAAGIAILANRTSFVSDTIQSAACGIVVDFAQAAKLESAINDLTKNYAQRTLYGEKARLFFDREFNWEAVSKRFYEALVVHTDAYSPDEFQLFKLNSDPYISERTCNSPSKIIFDKPLISSRRSILFTAMRKCWHMLPDRLRMHLVPVASRIQSRYSTR